MSTTSRPPFGLGIALDGAGWHPAACRDAAADPHALTTLSHWRRIIGRAEAGGLDFATLEDSFAAQAVPAALPSRLDALLIASAVAPSTSRIGLIPTVTVTHTEPFHVATSLQTLDHVSHGRGGWRLQVSPTAAEAALFGRRAIPDLAPDDLRGVAGEALVAELFGEAADVAEVVRRLWDSWEDDAVIRDVATGRYLDRERIHGAAFSGRLFSVEGASIVPRSPQGQPPVTVLAHRTEPYELAARAADLVFVTPQDDADAQRILAEVRAAESRVGRFDPTSDGFPTWTPTPLRVYADLLVVLEDTAVGARAALDRLDSRSVAPLESDALVVATTIDGLVERLAALHAAGYDGVRLRPARIPADLDAIAERLVPALVRAGVRTPAAPPAPGTGPRSLRTALDLPSAPNRYAAARAAAPAPPASPSAAASAAAASAAAAPAAAPTHDLATQEARA